MDEEERKLVANPSLSSNFISRFVTLSWLNSLFKKGYRETLNDSDIYEVLPRDSTDNVARRLERCWEHELKTSKKPNICVAFVKAAGLRYFGLSIFIIVELTLRLIQPIYIGKVVGIFQDEVQDKKSGYIFAAAITICACTEVLMKHSICLQLMRTGMNLRVAACALVYRKALRMSQASLSSTNTGQIVNLVTNDVAKFEEAGLFALYFFLGSFQLAGGCYLIWREIGYSFIPGMILLFSVTPFQSWLGKFFASLRAKTAILRDERIKIMNEVICGMKVIKMYTWENPFAKLVANVRRKEIGKVLKTSRLLSLNASFYLFAIPVVTMAMFITYVLTGNTLTSEKVFTVISIIATLSHVTSVYVPKGIAALRESGVSLERIQNFLELDEGLPLSVNQVDDENPRVVVEEVCAAWDKGGADQALCGVSFRVSAGELLMVVGPVGCGKSSLLMALLRELPVTRGNIRLSGKVAYVSQQPWVFSGTFKENILFGKKYDQKKYEEVIRVCSLERILTWASCQAQFRSELCCDVNDYHRSFHDTKDVESLMHGDKTMVGERGVSLSGGQKARVNLARAVYLDASIYIMDDPLSAVDAHVSRHIFNECICGILSSKVRILVSHQLQFLNDANRILCLNKGKVVGYGDLQSLKERGVDVISMVHTDQKREDSSSLKSDEQNALLDNFLHFPTTKKKRSRYRKDEDTQSLFGIHGETEPLLEIPEEDLDLQFKAKSFHDLERDSKIVPDVTFCPVVTCDTEESIASNLVNGDLMEMEGVNLEESKKIVAEGRSTGRVTFKVYKDYLLAGARPVFLFLCFLIFLSGQVVICRSDSYPTDTIDWWLLPDDFPRVVFNPNRVVELLPFAINSLTVKLPGVSNKASLMVCEWFLAKWSDWEENTVAKNDSQIIVDEKRSENISTYVGLVLVVFVFAFVRAAILFQILIQASRHLHDVMFRALLRAPMYFFDTNPVGRILNRFSKDIGSMDDKLPAAFFDACQLSVQACAIIVLSVSSQPYSAVAAVPVLLIFAWLRQYYIKSSREIKRVEALSRSPLYSHISATLQGLPTIRASEEQPQFLSAYNKFQDHNSSAWYLSLAGGRWLGFRLDSLCSLLFGFVTFAPFLATEAGLSVNPVLVGLSLIYTKRLTGMFQFSVRQTAEVENQMVSVERVQEYTRIEPEAPLEIADKKPSDDWPQHGAIAVEDLVFRYHPSLPNVLKGVCFDIKAKEKIGIVGRTGAGKSSLISALFRLAEPSGMMNVDGVSITNIGLHDLRRRLSIIPQDPVIFGGSIRRNLDPFNNHEDIEIWNALEQVQLKEVVNNYPEKLEFQLTESGNNLSVGQRQLMCLARAILKHNKILIIDEATANVDHRTDQLIQETIREKFKDCTVLTIAHRLNTIMDADRIMVLDSGRIVEFEEPYKLLQRPDSQLFKVVQQTGKETSMQLQKIAKSKCEERTLGL